MLIITITASSYSLSSQCITVGIEKILKYSYQTITYLFRRDIGQSINHWKTCIQIRNNETIFITTRPTEWSNAIEYKIIERWRILWNQFNHIQITSPGRSKQLKRFKTHTIIFNSSSLTWEKEAHSSPIICTPKCHA